MYWERRRILRDLLKKENKYIQKGSKLLKKGQGELDACALLSKSTLVKDSRTVTAGILNGLFIKKYNTKNFYKAFKRFFQYPRSRRCLIAASILEKLHILTPEVLYSDRYYLITKALEGKITDIFICYHPEKVFDFAPLLAHLHENGFYHGDLSLRNIYSLPDGKMGVIDLDGVILYSGKVPVRKRIAECARLISSGCLLLQTENVEETAEKILKSYEEASTTPLPFEKVIKEAKILMKKTDMSWMKNHPPSPV